MCDAGVASKQPKKHHHSFRFKCRTKQLCIFSFVFYCTSCGIFCNASLQPTNMTQRPEEMVTVNLDLKSAILENAITDTSQSTPTEINTSRNSALAISPASTQPKLLSNGTDDSVTLHCDDSGCYIKIFSDVRALEKMLAVSKYLFENYATPNGSVTKNGLEILHQDLFPKGKSSVPEIDTSAHNHDHNSPTHDHDHNHVIESDAQEPSSTDEESGQFFLDALLDFEDPPVEDTKAKKPCYNSVQELTEAYFKSTDERIQLSLGDLITLLPQVVLDITRPACVQSNQGNLTETESAIKPNARNVWLLSFGSVTIISVVSLVGVLTVPLLRYSKLLNHVIAYLVALAVGTLCGDALLHLLPQATGVHSHSSGEHTASDHFDYMWKGLVVCAGIYFFFLLENIMGFIHKRKEKSRKCRTQSDCHNSKMEEHQCTAELHKVNNSKRHSMVSPSNSPLLSNGKCASGAMNITPLVDEPNNCNHGEHDGKPEGHGVMVAIDMETLDTGHHHHFHSDEVPKTIASLAWMVIVGDGLHNITDGLAIGAAFTNSIGAGLGTVLAIFFHEIPQELADFAVLLNAGMTVKQALLWNFLSACMCFIGLVIGLLLGEFTDGIILWILAFTAGGFLYIALVDMLPALMKQLSQKGSKQRFVIQNLGMLSGFALMVGIALKEESFESYFNQ